jgi:hypothetical protein
MNDRASSSVANVVPFFNVIGRVSFADQPFRRITLAMRRPCAFYLKMTLLEARADANEAD